MSEPVRIHGLTEEELIEVDPMVLRAIVHERTHHTIEVNMYRIMAGKRGIQPNFGETAELLLDIWKRRGLPTDAPDIQWCLNYIGLARMLRTGGELELDTELPEPFTDEEMKAVDKLIFDLRGNGGGFLQDVYGCAAADSAVDPILGLGNRAFDDEQVTTCIYRLRFCFLRQVAGSGHDRLVVVHRKYVQHHLGGCGSGGSQE